MSHRVCARTRALGPLLLLAGVVALGASTPASAGWPRARRTTPRYVPTSAPRVAGVAPSPMLGTFYPQPFVNIRGNFNAGGGYSPLGIYGEGAAMPIYGPLSVFRAEAAPVQLYQRGYDGVLRPEVGTGFSYPNFPAAGGVVYPTRANYRGAGPRLGTPPQWDSGINYIDLD